MAESRARLAGIMILIVSEATDPTAAAVARLLSARGKAFAWIDRGDYPATSSLTYAIGPTSPPSRRWRRGDDSVALDDVRSIWWRRPLRSRAAASITDEPVRRYVEMSGDEVFAGVLDDVDCLHVPARRPTVRRAQEKIPQLSLARSLGLEVPDTLVTNDPAELLAFYERHAGNVVTKATAVGVDSFVQGGFSGYTRLLRPRDLPFVHDVALCPVTAQSYVEKKVELRVTVVGDDVFAAEIHSQATRRTRVDWRHYDERNTTHRAHALPAPVARVLLELTRALGLVYSAIDLVLTPDDRYVFLEVNPNGQYQWIEDATALPISARIATLLSEGA